MLPSEPLSAVSPSLVQFGSACFVCHSMVSSLFSCSPFSRRSLLWSDNQAFVVVVVVVVCFPLPFPGLVRVMRFPWCSVPIQARRIWQGAWGASNSNNSLVLFARGTRSALSRTSFANRGHDDAIAMRRVQSRVNARGLAVRDPTGRRTELFFVGQMALQFEGIKYFLFGLFIFQRDHST